MYTEEVFIGGVVLGLVEVGSDERNLMLNGDNKQAGMKADG